MGQPIRVLCVFAVLNRGGAETMCMNLYRALDHEKVQLDFVKHTTALGDYEDEILSLGGKIYEAPHYNILNKLQYEAWWRAFFREHSEYRLVHGHFFTISNVYFKVAHEFGITTIGHSHSEQANIHSIKFWLKRHSVKAIERESDLCLACSEAAGKYLFPNKDFSILKNAIDAQKFKWNPDIGKEIRKELSINESSFVVGVCGSFSVPKNPLGIIDIFHEIHKKNDGAILLWVGDGDLRQEIEDRIKAYKLSDAVILTGVRPDVYRLMQAMDVFILPSLWEGLAVVSIEAQAAGLPCYFSDTVTKECQVTEQCIFLPLNKPAAWAKAILESDNAKTNTTDQIIAAGFDISTTSQWLESFYLAHYNDNLRDKGIMVKCINV